MFENEFKIYMGMLKSCAHTVQVNSFELFGFDLLIDSSLKVWLLEANSSPSLEYSNCEEKKLKAEIIRDVLQLVNPLSLDWKAIEDLLKQQVNLWSSPRRENRSDNPSIDIQRHLKVKS